MVFDKAAYMKKWERENRDTIRRRASRRKAGRRDRLKKYGLTLQDYEDMVEAQEGVCAICGEPETQISRWGTPILLSVDHDHKTNKVRELLCRHCNVLLGMCREDIEVLLNAISYIEKHDEEG